MLFVLFPSKLSVTAGKCNWFSQTGYRCRLLFPLVRRTNLFLLVPQQRHESKVHVELMMTMEKRWPGTIG